MRLSVIAYGKWNFRVIDASRALLRSEPLKRDTYAKLPEWVEESNVVRNLLKPLYGISTACKDWCGAVRDFLANECVCVCVCGVTSLDKSVFFGTQQGFDYGYGKGVRDQNTPNLDKGILKANQDFETSEQRNAIGIIAIRVDDLLVSGNGMSVVYISQKMKGV